MSFFAAIQSLRQQPPMPKQGVHGMFTPEDFENGGICGQCATWAKGNFERYVNIVFGCHDLDLSDMAGEREAFMLWIAGEEPPSNFSASEFVKKISQWNKIRKEFAEMFQ